MERLQRQELFALLSPKELERVSAGAGVARLKEGERVYSEGVPASHLFVLLKGRVELRRPTKGGLSLLVDDLLEGAVFGVSCLTGTDRYLLNAECVEDVEVLVNGEERIRQAGPLVVAGHEEHRDPTRGHAPERRERGLGEPGGDAAPVVQVAAVDDHVDLAPARGLEGAREAGEEVGPPPAAVDPRPRGQVEAEVGVGDEQDPQGHTHRSTACSRRRESRA